MNIVSNLVTYMKQTLDNIIIISLLSLIHL